ncbi:hypothetical protein A3850_016230 [Lewinella sp. 4G2]|nr:hypothetical protein A3850_016230 [Lewinella sp. 4G2]
MGLNSAPEEFRWSLERYHDAIEKGVLTELDKVELLFGKIIPKMPVGEPHADVLSDITDFFYEQFGTRFKYRVQNPVTLPNDSEPEPDFAVVERRKYNRSTGHPNAENIHLLIEIADSTLEYDRTSKMEAYALAGIKEYWIVNIRERQLEFHAEPIIAKGIYGSRSVHEAGSRFTSPLAGELLVDSMLPEV